MQSRWGFDATPPSGAYTLRAVGSAADGQDIDHALKISPELLATLPEEACLPTARLRFLRSAVAGNLTVRLEAPLASDELGALNQRRLQNTVPALTQSPVETGTMLFQSFGGRSVGDSVLALYQELERRGDKRTKYWVTRDHSTPVPPGSHRVLMFSRDWYRILHTAEYLVNNDIFAPSFRKNPGQTYIQTWHGTPLKRIGSDAPNNRMPLAEIAQLQREIGYWDLLLAQNEYAASTLPKALGYAGQVLVSGSPKNDALLGEAAMLRRAAVRAALGIRPNVTAVLYTPTWRDEITDFRKPHGHIDYLDYPMAQHMLGPDYVFLRRAHQDMTGDPGQGLPPNCMDPTTYPDINDLYLAADALVTDYSSIMFDFCVTGKPIFVLAPDIDRFRAGPRGMYFDIEAVPPGPVVRSTSELVQAMSSQPQHDRYREFAKRFVTHDDGRAAGRAVDAIWGPAQ